MILLDTCAPLRLADSPARLRAAAQALLRAPVAVANVSAISAWELTLKYRLGRLGLGMASREWDALAV